MRPSHGKIVLQRWGSVPGARRNYLEFKGSEKPFTLRQESEFCTYKKSDDYVNSEWGARLDLNHQFFAFIDSGLQGGKKAFGSKIDGRLLIEKELGSSEVASKGVPHVLVVVNGGPGSIRTVHTLAI